MTVRTVASGSKLRSVTAAERVTGREPHRAFSASSVTCDVMSVPFSEKAVTRTGATMSTVNAEAAGVCCISFPSASFTVKRIPS